jgi:hypothetical protein
MSRPAGRSPDTVAAGVKAILQPAASQPRPCNGRYGSTASFSRCLRYVRSYTITGLMHRSNLQLYSITSSARARMFDLSGTAMLIHISSLHFLSAVIADEGDAARCR